MKALFSLILFAVMQAATAQVKLSVVAGLNGTSVHSSHELFKTDFKTGGAPGFQIGLQALRDFNKWQLYTGLMFEKEYFHRDIPIDSALLHYPLGFYYSYHPALLTVPLMAGYKLTLTKKLGLRLYGGLYGTMGVGGKYQEDIYCDPMACPEIRRDIDYGKRGAGNTPQMARFSWGGRFGFGLASLRYAELDCMYSAGLSDFLTPDILSPKYRQQSVSIELKVPIMQQGKR